MTVTVDPRQQPVPIHVDRHGITFTRHRNGSVAIEVEYDDGDFTRECCVVIGREDWDAVVAHVSHYGASLTTQPQEDDA